MSILPDLQARWRAVSPLSVACTTNNQSELTFLLVYQSELTLLLVYQSELTWLLVYKSELTWLLVYQSEVTLLHCLKGNRLSAI